MFTVARIQPVGGVAVTIATQSVTGIKLELRGQLWQPTELTKGAAVLVHGSGSWSDYRESHYGRALSTTGYAAPAIDTFGISGTGGTSEAWVAFMCLQRIQNSPVDIVDL